MKKVELMFLVGDTVKYTNKDGREITGEVYSISLDEAGVTYLAYSAVEDMFFRFSPIMWRKCWIIMQKRALK